MGACTAQSGRTKRRASRCSPAWKTRSSETKREWAAFDETLQRSIGALLRKKNKGRPILDMDPTEDPAHENQEGVEYNGHFGKSCYHPH
jgi:hypothetical protein